MMVLTIRFHLINRSQLHNTKVGSLETSNTVLGRPLTVARVTETWRGQRKEAVDVTVKTWFFKKILFIHVCVWFWIFASERSVLSLRPDGTRTAQIVMAPAAEWPFSISMGHRWGPQVLILSLRSPHFFITGLLRTYCGFWYCAFMGFLSVRTEETHAAWAIPFPPGLGTDHTQKPISSTKRSFVQQDRETGWLNLNWVETAAGGSTGVFFKENKMGSP